MRVDKIGTFLLLIDLIGEEKMSIAVNKSTLPCFESIKRQKGNIFY